MVDPGEASGAPRAADIIALLADPQTFRLWDAEIVSTDPLSFHDLKPYRERLTQAAMNSYGGESIVTGSADLNGRPVALIVADFAFLAGSVGTAAGERVCRAFERAAASRLPVLSVTASGGTRMQEGVLAFIQMVATVQALRDFTAEGQVHVVYLMNPTTGGVLASWGSLGHLLFAAPSALIGFSGPRVVALAQGSPFPANDQRSESLLTLGLIDDVFPPEQLKERMTTLLMSLDDNAPSTRPEPIDEEIPETDPWKSVQLSRARDRPGARALINFCAQSVTYLRGDRMGGGDDSGCITAVAHLSGMPAVLIAQDRDSSLSGAQMSPSGYRKARRAMALAAQLRVPLVTIVDTPGAEISITAEQTGLAHEIASCLHDMVGLPIPSLCVLLGEGGGGGALALVPTDCVIAAQNAWLSPINPEGAATILFRSIDRAADLARAQAIAAWQLKRLGIVDRVVPERPSASQEPDAFLARIAAAIVYQLSALREEPAEQRALRRAGRYRGLGVDAQKVQ